MIVAQSVVAPTLLNIKPIRSITPQSAVGSDGADARDQSK